MIRRGEVWWADLGAPQGSRPAQRRPVLVVQSWPYNSSDLATVVVTAITSNTGLAAMPGNVFLPATASGLPRDSVVSVTSVDTVNKADLSDKVGALPETLMEGVDRGLRRLLAL